MNREIKFRIWCKMMQRWLCEDSQFLQMDGKKVHAAPWSTIEFDLPNENYIVQQYTGLKDKNGIPIFEGDLVKAHLKTEEIGEITFDRGGFCFNSKSLKGTFLGIVESGFTIEVVGNIFEK